MPKKSENYSSNEDLELKSDITTEFQMLLDTEVGLDQSRYELETVLEPSFGSYSYHYKAEVRILDEDDEMLDSFADNADELYDHLSSEFPRVRFDIRVESGSSAVTASEFADSDEDEVAGDYSEDSEDDDDEESLEEQFEGEGLRIIDSIDEADSPVYERGEEDEEDEEEEELPKSKKRKKVSDLDDDLEDIELDDVDDYEPDEEDREELWKAFGDFDD